MSMRENVIYFIKKNIFIVLVLIGLCPVLALSYAKLTINSESYRSNEMYISELLYSIKIDNENTYTIDIEPAETEHTIEITSLSGISTNYKLAYLNNDKLEIRYASDYVYASSECYNDDSMLGSNLSDSAKDYGNDKCKNSDWLLPQTN